MSSPLTSSPISSAQKTSTPSPSMLVNLDDSDLVADLPPWYFEDPACSQLDASEIERMLNESYLETPFMPAREPVLPGAPARVARALAYEQVYLDETIPWAETSIKREPLTPRLPPFTPIRIPAAPREAFDVIEFPLAAAEEEDDDENDKTIVWQADDDDENKENIAPRGCDGCYACLSSGFSTSLPDERTLKKMRY